MRLEQRGTPAAVINTEPLAEVADAMAAALGFPGYRYALVPHPVGSLGPEEVQALAKKAAPCVLALLRGEQRAPATP